MITISNPTFGKLGLGQFSELDEKEISKILSFVVFQSTGIKVDSLLKSLTLSLNYSVRGSEESYRCLTSTMTDTMI